jgi:hypothetical protein
MACLLAAGFIYSKAWGWHGHGKLCQHLTLYLKSKIFDFHWLPVRARVEFKVLTTVYKCIHGQAPLYLTDLLIPYKSPRVLRSCTRRHNVTNFRGGAFQTLVPTIWNSLDFDFRKTDSLDKFRKGLWHIFSGNISKTRRRGCIWTFVF